MRGYTPGSRRKPMNESFHNLWECLTRLVEIYGSIEKVVETWKVVEL